jgi:hypothetical protein
MAYAPRSWRKVYSSVNNGLEPKTLLALCERARRLMQDRLVELSSARPEATEAEAERNDIEEGLRRLWKIEQRARKSLS